MKPTLESKAAEINKGQPKSAAGFEDICDWLSRRLVEQSQVTKSDFENEFGEKNDVWSRATHGICAALRAVDLQVSLKDNTLTLSSLVRKQRRFENTYFTPQQFATEKAKIGWLVAHYLKQRDDRNVFLGSGSTVYHVGDYMKRIANHDKGGEYKQLFWTINLALAAMWCEGEDRKPVARVLVPKGELRTATFRYDVMDHPKWNGPIAVVGADGCYYHDRKSILYANEEHVAKNTNDFASSALDTVICCIVSKKLEYKEDEGQNAGPQIDGPIKDLGKPGPVKWYLVTDKKPDEKNLKVSVLKDAGWKIISDLSDWPHFNGNPIGKIVDLEPRHGASAG